MHTNITCDGFQLVTFDEQDIDSMYDREILQPL